MRRILPLILFLAFFIPITTKATFYDTKAVRKTADETVNNSTTLQNDDDLSLSLTSGTWICHSVLAYDSNTTADFKYNYTYSGTVTSSRTFGFGLSLTTTGTTGDLQVVSPGINNARQTGGSGSGTFANTIIDFTIVASTDGTLQLQFAQNTADASDTILKSNSFISCQEISTEQTGGGGSGTTSATYSTTTYAVQGIATSTSDAIEIMAWGIFYGIVFIITITSALLTIYLWKLFI